MHKIWNFIIDIVIALSIMFLGVAIYYGLRTETLIKTVTSNITEDFLFEVKGSGSLTLSGYENYIEQLSLTDALYDISFEHKYQILEPEYRFRTLEEIIEAQNAAYTGPNDYHYWEVVTQKPEVSDPINTGNLNTETNESVLAKAVNTPTDPNHVHTEECYSGHRHAGVAMFNHTHQHTGYCIEYTGLIMHEYTCGDCGTSAKRFLASYYWDPATNSAKLSASNGGTAECLLCGSQNLIESVMRFGYDYSCGYNIDINSDGYNDSVGNQQAYTYQRSEPQPQEVETKRTYTSGCYTYHKKGYIKIGLHDYYGTPYYDKGEIYKLLTHGFTSFCEVPETIEVKYKYGEHEDSYYTVYFFPKYENGVITFSCRSGVHLNINESFPNVDYNTFYNLFMNRNDEFYYFLRNNLRWETVIPGGSVSIYEMYKTKVICEEPIHDSWYTTCGLVEDGTIACNQMVVSLIPTHSKQTVYTNDRLITTAVATFRDGSKRTIVCTTSFSTANVIIDAPVTLVYSYSIAGKNFSNSCQITVTVIRRNKTCVNGHTYNLNNDGSDPGCPYCHAWVRNLRVTYPATSTFTITIGTTLQDNGVTILVTYMDGHTETITSGYMDNLDTGYLGTKLVTIGYKGATTTLMVTTVRARIICDICGFEYELYPDGTNPGCPRCISKTPVFTGNILEYERIEYTENILETVHEYGEYRMNKNDVFTVNLSNKSSNIARKLLGKFFPSLSDRWVLLRKSGRIKTN